MADATQAPSSSKRVSSATGRGGHWWSPGTRGRAASPQSESKAESCISVPERAFWTGDRTRVGIVRPLRIRSRRVVGRVPNVWHGSFRRQAAPRVRQLRMPPRRTVGMVPRLRQQGRAREHLTADRRSSDGVALPRGLGDDDGRRTHDDCGAEATKGQHVV
jgi:hypothetical protein